MLAGLRETNHRRLVGVELDEQKILTGISRGLDVIQADLNKGLGAFATGQFDCVVLSQTLQAVQDVEGVLTEMVRIGRTCIVSIPNFGYHRLRQHAGRDGPRARNPPASCTTNGTTPPTSASSPLPTSRTSAARRTSRSIGASPSTPKRGSEVFEHPNLNADLAIFVISAS